MYFNKPIFLFLQTMYFIYNAYIYVKVTVKMFFRRKLSKKSFIICVTPRCWVTLNTKLLRIGFCKFMVSSIIHLSSPGSMSRKIDSVLVSSILDANLNSPLLFSCARARTHHTHKKQCAVSSLLPRFLMCVFRFYFFRLFLDFYHRF